MRGDLLRSGQFLLIKTGNDPVMISINDIVVITVDPESNGKTSSIFMRGPKEFTVKVSDISPSDIFNFIAGGRAI